MNQLYLGLRLGGISSPAFQRHQYERLARSLQPRTGITFDLRRLADDTAQAYPAQPSADGAENLRPTAIAHQAGVNCLAIDGNDGSTLISGGADSTIHLWDLSRDVSASSNPVDRYHPRATLSKSTADSHTHAITSVSIYPFDPTPATLLSTSFDNTLKVISITPSSLQPLHTYRLPAAAYSHDVSSSPTTPSSPHPTLALATGSPTIPLLDLRSPLPTHSLPGHNAAVYSLCWHPTLPHILASASADSRCLLFDVRRASAAFASLDLDDAIGVATPLSQGGRDPMSWTARAHNGPVTGVAWTDNGSNLVTAGHDQRIRLWDATTGKNELVHFGPRVRNSRVGELKPLLTPSGCGRPGHEMLLWPNDDGRGEIFLYGLREGDLVALLRTPGMDRARAQAGAGVGRLTSGGRINGLVWRWNKEACGAGGVEMYSAHGDGRLVGWIGMPDEDDEDENGGAESSGGLEQGNVRAERRKRKRDLVGDLVEGLTGMKRAFVT